MTEQEIAGLVDEVESGLATTGDPLVDEARRRFERAAEWDAAWRISNSLMGTRRTGTSGRMAFGGLGMLAVARV